MSTTPKKYTTKMYFVLDSRSNGGNLISEMLSFFYVVLINVEAGSSEALCHANVRSTSLVVFHMTGENLHGSHFTEHSPD